MFQGHFEEGSTLTGAPPKRQFYSIFEDMADNSMAGTDDDDATEDHSHDLHVEKKRSIRRLGADQVKSLEKSFWVDNKLSPERKLELAGELGLQPRQVAVWFQNRKARWKSKQLEQDYLILRSEYGALKAEYEAAIQEKEELQAQVLHLNEKFRTGTGPDHRLLQLESLTSDQPGSMFEELSLHLHTNESAQSSLGSDQMSVLPPTTTKGGSSSSNSTDESEVLEVESPPVERHPICSELALNLGCADPSSLSSIKEEAQERELPQIQTQRSIPKLEPFPEESSNLLFPLEVDPATGFPWWDWP